MTGFQDATADDAAPHAAAEQDDRDPSRAANQIRDEPIPPTPADDSMPASHSNQPDASSDGMLSPQLAPRLASLDAHSPAGPDPDRPQAGAPDSAVTDLTPALGTSEGLEPVQGVHTPDVGPGE